MAIESTDVADLFSGRLLSEREMVLLAHSMAKELPIVDRSTAFTTYERVFVGSDAARWLVNSGVTTTADEAIGVGNQMLCVGLIHHAQNEHLFENKDDLFYRYHPTW